MSNLNEIGKFDSLFKSAAIDYELPFNEDAWKLMQQKLDGNQSKKRKGIFWWLLPIVVAAIGTGFYYFTKNESPIKSVTLVHQPTTSVENTNNNGNKNSMPDQQKEAATTNAFNENANTDLVAKDDKQSKTKIIAEKANEIKAIKEIASIKTSVNSDNLNTNKNNKNLIDSKLNKNFEIKSNSKNTTNNAANNDLSVLNKDTKLNSKNIEASSLPKATINDIPKNASNTVVKSDIQSNTNIDADLNSISNIASSKNETRYYTPNVSMQHKRYIPNFKQLEKDNLIVIAAREQAEKDAVNSKYIFNPFLYSIYRNRPSSHWYLLGSLASNIGYVSNPELRQTSLQYQFGVGYNLSKYVSLQTGVSFGNRTFSIRKEQFSYKGNPAYEKGIKSIEADISLIDVPITLRCQYSDKENSGWFSTVGVSTLFLRREDYTLAIQNGAGAIVPYNQNFNNAIAYLATLNLSFGYQYPVNKLFTLTVEPYIQLPFKVVGDGGTKMSQIGLQFSGKYHFLKSKKK